MQIFLETERLILRQFTEDDADNLFELNSDPEVTKLTGNLGQPTSYSVITTEMLPKFFRYYQQYTSYGYWAAIEKSSQSFIGWFLFRPVADSFAFDPKFFSTNDIELGYRLRKSAWGKGYATEGAKAIIKKGFSEGIERIVAVAFAANLASIRVLEKAGLTFKLKVIYEKNNQEVVLYAINQREYDDLNSSSLLIAER